MLGISDCDFLVILATKDQKEIQKLEEMRRTKDIDADCNSK